MKLIYHILRYTSQCNSLCFQYKNLYSKINLFRLLKSQIIVELY